MERRVYQAQLQLLFTIARQIKTLDLAEMRSQIERSHTAGSTIDPARYREGRDHLRYTEDIIRAAQEFQAHLNRIEPPQVSVGGPRQ